MAERSNNSFNDHLQRDQGDNRIRQQSTPSGPGGGWSTFESRANAFTSAYYLDQAIRRGWRPNDQQNLQRQQDDGSFLQNMHQTHEDIMQMQSQELLRKEPNSQQLLDWHTTSMDTSNINTVTMSSDRSLQVASKSDKQKLFDLAENKDVFDSLDLREVTRIRKNMMKYLYNNENDPSLSKQAKDAGEYIKQESNRRIKFESWKKFVDLAKENDRFVPYLKKFIETSSLSKASMEQPIEESRTLKQEELQREFRISSSGILEETSLETNMQTDTSHFTMTPIEMESSKEFFDLARNEEVFNSLNFKEVVKIRASLMQTLYYQGTDPSLSKQAKDAGEYIKQENKRIEFESWKKFVDLAEENNRFVYYLKKIIETSSLDKDRYSSENSSQDMLSVHKTSTDYQTINLSNPSTAHEKESYHDTDQALSQFSEANPTVDNILSQELNLGKLPDQSKPRQRFTELVNKPGDSLTSEETLDVICSMDPQLLSDLASNNPYIDSMRAYREAINNNKNLDKQAAISSYKDFYFYVHDIPGSTHIEHPVWQQRSDFNQLAGKNQWIQGLTEAQKNMLFQQLIPMQKIGEKIKTGYSKSLNSIENKKANKEINNDEYDRRKDRLMQVFIEFQDLNDFTFKFEYKDAALLQCKKIDEKTNEENEYRKSIIDKLPGIKNIAAEINQFQQKWNEGMSEWQTVKDPKAR